MRFIISYFILQGGPGVQDAHYSIMELTERLGALGAGPSAVGAAAAACRGKNYFTIRQKSDK